MESLKASVINKRDVSPNPSVARSNRSRLSFVGTTNTTESRSTDSSDATKEGNNLGGVVPQPYSMMITQSPLTQPPADIGSLKQQQLQLRPPILGIQPTFVSSSLSAAAAASIASPLGVAFSPRVSGTENPENVLKGQRALMYVWLVRRWLKKRQTSLLSGIHLGGAGNGNDSGGFFNKGKQLVQEVTAGGPASLPYGGVEVRFEWKRARVKESKKGGSVKKRRGRATSRRRTTSGGADSDGELERQSVRELTRERDEKSVSGDVKQRLKTEEKRRNRMSTGSFSTTNGSDENADPMQSRRLQREGTRGDDDGDESDPEDSETPWVCTLKIRRSAAAAAAASSSNPRGLLSPMTSDFNGNGMMPPSVTLEPQVLRIKVGTLSPTPHHPKVVAMLKVPFPLPDVEVERMSIVKRTAAPASQSEGGTESYHGLTLTAEEIKDIVCSTGLWLVVREGFGGVGRVSRKGDGWRIRA